GRAHVAGDVPPRHAPAAAIPSPPRSRVLVVVLATGDGVTMRVLIIGATSAIAEATARLYAGRGARLFLVGRDEARLSAIAADLGVRGAAATLTHVLDATDLAGHAAMLDAAWASLGGVDLALIAHGTLPDQAACSASVDESMREFAINGSSVI